MKKALTMIELVFVIVVIGILSAVIIPRVQTNPLQEAAIQLVADIRYTQHLAFIDDKYETTAGSVWFKKRWQLEFGKPANADGKFAYTIYADDGGSGDADEGEIAINPQNPNQIMTGGHNGTVKMDINHKKFRGMKKLNLGWSYGVTTLTMSSVCKVSGSTRIAFDHLGRPIKGKLGLASGGGNTEAYELNNLIHSNCDITLGDGVEAEVIRVHPETGYACILNDARTSCI